jgi:hypothetical protein
VNHSKATHLAKVKAGKAMAEMSIPIHQATIDMTQVSGIYVLWCPMPTMKKYRKVTKGNG